MRLMKVNYSSGLLLKAFRLCVMRYVDIYKNTEAMIEIKKEFNDDNFRNALSQIYIDGDYICYNASNRLLRLLEFGGPNIKALNILSRVVHEFNRGG